MGRPKSVFQQGNSPPASKHQPYSVSKLFQNCFLQGFHEYFEAQSLGCVGGRLQG